MKGLFCALVLFQMVWELRGVGKNMIPFLKDLIGWLRNGN